jgi:hypothetical protein
MLMSQLDHAQGALFSTDGKAEVLSLGEASSDGNFKQAPPTQSERHI